MKEYSVKYIYEKVIEISKKIKGLNSKVGLLKVDNTIDSIILFLSLLYNNAIPVIVSNDNNINQNMKDMEFEISLDGYKVYSKNKTNNDKYFKSNKQKFLVFQHQELILYMVK